MCVCLGMPQGQCLEAAGVTWEYLFEGFSSFVQELSEQGGGELKPDEIWAAFNREYVNNRGPYELLDYNLFAPEPGTEIFNGKIARMVGNNKAVRAVGTANAKNPLPIIIPCHRIISSNGNIGGYSGGLDKKLYLLDHENNLFH